MSYTVLARKYRPQTFREVIGQDHVTVTLKNALAQGRIAHGYIFSGHRGIGKTTIARVLAMALNCRSSDHPVTEPCGVCDSCVEIREGRSVDVMEIDAATNRGIDEIRELREAARYRPARDRYRIYILDEAHQITDAAFNALLKTLEEPPGYIVFMMATTQPEDVPQTIRSRCQNFSFHAVKFDDIVAQLGHVAELEHIEADDRSLAMLAEAGDGSMRDALSILDQAIACCGARLTSDTVRELAGTVPSEMMEEIMRAVQRNSSEDVLRLVDKLVCEGQNPVHIARQMARFLRNALVAKVAGETSPLLQISTDERRRAARVAEQFSEEDLARFLQILLRTHSELAYKQEQRFHLELGLLKMVHAQRLLPIEQLLSGAEVNTGQTARGGSQAHSAVGGMTPARSPAAARQGPSPFAADMARKSTGGSASAGSVPALGAGASPSQNLPGGAATAVATATEENPGPPPAAAPPAANLAGHAFAAHIIAAAESAGFNDLAQMLRGGDWNVNGSEISVQVAESPKLVEMAFRKEAQQALNAAAAAYLARPARLKVFGGANGHRTEPPLKTVASAGKAAAVTDEPVIRRLQEKFGAEIRSIIDYREQK